MSSLRSVGKGARIRKNIRICKIVQGGNKVTSYKLIRRGYITHSKGIKDPRQIRSGSVENDAGE